MAKFLFRIPAGSTFTVTGAYGIPPEEVDALGHLHEMAKIARAKPKSLNSAKDLWEVKTRTSDDELLFSLATVDFRNQFVP